MHLLGAWACVTSRHVMRVRCSVRDSIGLSDPCLQVNCRWHGMLPPATHRIRCRKCLAWRSLGVRHAPFPLESSVSGDIWCYERFPCAPRSSRRHTDAGCVIPKGGAALFCARQRCWGPSELFQMQARLVIALRAGPAGKRSGFKYSRNNGRVGGHSHEILTTHC